MKEKSVSDQLRDVIHTYQLISRNEIAREAGVDPGQLSRFMNGQRTINDVAFSKLCRYLRLELRPIGSLP
jgi:hypothetical protein